MQQQLSIDGVIIKTPDTFKITRYNLTKAGRVISGKMTMDLIAKKRKFIFSYTIINNLDLQVILDLIDSDRMFFELEYVENNELKYATVYSGEIPLDQYRTGNVWWWKDVELHLIEQ